MSQLPGRPDPGQIREAGQAVTVLSAEARELIDAQFADRPHLRPVLDAVLAALPGIGPVTVQARTTLVSLVTPRRTFAVVRATTKNRVDLGLRLDSTPPGGRLLASQKVIARRGRHVFARVRPARAIFGRDIRSLHMEANHRGMRRPD